MIQTLGAVTLTSVFAQVAEVVTGIGTTVGSTVTIITGNPILMIGVGVGLLGTAIGLIKKFL